MKEIQSFLNKQSQSAEFLGFIRCPDQYRQRRALELLLVLPKFAGAEVLKFEASGLDKKRLEALSNEAGNLSLFSSSKIIVLRSVESLSTALIDEALKRLSEISKSSAVLLLASKKPRSPKIKKFFKDRGSLLELEEFDTKQAQDFAAELIEVETGHKAPAKVTSFLASLAEDSADQLASFCECYALYLGEEKPSLKRAQELFASYADPNEFGFLDELSSKRTAAALLNTERMKRSGQNAYQLFGLLSRHYAQLAASKGNAGAQALPGPDWLKRKLAGQAQGYNKRDIWRIAAWMLRTDERLKGKSLGSDFEIDRLAEDIISR